MSYSIDDQIDKILDICHIDSDIARRDMVMREQLSILIQANKIQGGLEVIDQQRDRLKHFEVKS